MEACIHSNPVPLDSRADLCPSYILCELAERKPAPAPPQTPPAGPAITISYQTGSGEHEVAKRLAGILQAGESNGSGRWRVFDGQLVERALIEQRLPKAWAKRMPEDSRTYIQDMLDELFGLRPPSWIIVPQIAQTVLKLVKAGHVVLVGRGANFITAHLPNVFRVRLTAPLPERIARVQKLNHLTAIEAARLIATRDRGRARYMRAHFHARSDDESLYHMVVNTGEIPCPIAAQLIAETARESFDNQSR